MPRPNTGSIKKRSDTGRFRASLTIGYNDKGNAIKLSRDFDTKAEADYWLSQQKISSNKSLNASILTVAAFSDMWLESRSSRQLKTQHKDKDALDRYVLPSLGKVKIQSLEPVHIQKMLNELQQRTTPGMANEALRIVKTLCNDAIRLSILDKSPAQYIKPLPVKHRPPEIWTKDEVKQILNYLEQNKYQNWIDRYTHLGLATGMRRQEMLGLTWQDINMQECSITIKNTVVYIQGRFIRKDPKTEASARKIYFDSVTRDVLHTQKLYVEMIRGIHLNDLLRTTTKPKLPVLMVAYHLWQAGLVFPSLVGTPQPEKRLRLHFAALCKSAGVKTIGPNSLRSTWATHALESKKFTAKTIANRLGHTDVAFMLQRYARPGDAEQRGAAIDVGELFE